MSDFNELMKLIAEEKSKNPKTQQATIAKENAKSDLSILFSQLSEAKAQNPKAKLLKQVKEHVAEDITTLFGKINEKIEEVIVTEEPVAVEPEIIEQIEELVEQVEEIEKVEEKSSIEKYAEAIKEEKPFAQPDVPKVAPEMKVVTDKLKFLEQWVAKISAAGPGSGEVNFRYLDDTNRATMNPENDNWVLEYDATTKKVQFTENIGPVRTIKLNTAGYQTPLVAGQMGWNVEQDCLDIKQADDSTLQVGLEHYIQIHNTTGGTLYNGEVVMFSGVDEESHTNPIPIASRFTADTSAIPLYLIGVMTNDVLDGGHGRATVFGKIHNLNTTGTPVGETWAKGDLLWAHPTMAGKMTKVRPTAPNIATSVAAVLQVNATTGIILVRPTIFPRLYFASFASSLDQTQTVINTPKTVTFNTNIITSGFTVSGGVVTASNAGLYNFKFSLQVNSSNASNANFWIWIRKNGVDVPLSARKTSISGSNTLLVPSWNYQVSMAAGDTFELMWATDNVNVQLHAPAATAFCPTTPSATLAVSQVNL